MTYVALTRTGVVVALAASLALAGSDYVGYSGAPASLGRCAVSCHGTEDGTITVSGFPLEYEPGQAYTVTLGHDSGPALWNFNASVRSGSGSQTAGVISAGLYTETYSVPAESNGIHMTTYDHDTCTFLWTAPDSGVGEVRLYVAGHQDHTNGPNTSLMLISGQVSGVKSPAPVRPVVRFGVEPSVTSGPVVFRVSSPEPVHALIRVTDAIGRIVATFTLPGRESGEQVLLWPVRDRHGRRLAAGTYLIHATVASQRFLRSLVIRSR